jgi:osmoprotectant transport system substrate-binding protein
VRRARSVVVVVGLLAVLCASCSSPPPHRGRGRAITIGTFNFAESAVVGELYAQALEAAGVPVVRAFDLGTRELVEPALQRGLVDLVPEYGGSLLSFLTGEPSSADAAEVQRSLGDALAERGLTALTPAPAQDRNVVVVTAATARRYGLRDVSDLARVAGRLAVGGPPECPDRPLCLQGLASTYGLTFRRFVPLDESGPVTAGALIAGQVQVAVMFGSDGAIAANGLVVLRDDRGLQPAEHVTPVVRTTVLDRFGPVVAEVVDRVSAALTTTQLQKLNEAVTVRRRSPPAVAAEWLASNGLDSGVG